MKFDCYACFAFVEYFSAVVKRWCALVLTGPPPPKRNPHTYLTATSSLGVQAKSMIDSLAELGKNSFSLSSLSIYPPPNQHSYNFRSESCRLLYLCIFACREGSPLRLRCGLHLR